MTSTTLNIIIGYGYTGRYLAQQLIAQQQHVFACCRTPVTNMQWHALDLDAHNLQLPHIPWADARIFYLAPPLREGEHDVRLQQFIKALPIAPKACLYFSTTGVYGDCQGAWVKESTPLNPQSLQAQRRVDAEQQWHTYAKAHGCPLSILRVAGIYGPDRLPFHKVQQRSPIIKPEEAPWTNRIHVLDCVAITLAAMDQTQGIEVYNVADGNPQPFGALQKELAKQLNAPMPPELSFAAFKAQSSPQLLAFLQSRKVSINKLQYLGVTLEYVDSVVGVKQALSD